MKHIFFKLLPYRCDFLAMFILFEARFFLGKRSVVYDQGWGNKITRASLLGLIYSQLQLVIFSCKSLFQLVPLYS